MFWFVGWVERPSDVGDRKSATVTIYYCGLPMNEFILMGIFLAIRFLLALLAACAGFSALVLCSRELKKRPNAASTPEHVDFRLRDFVVTARGRSVSLASIALAFFIVAYLAVPKEMTFQDGTGVQIVLRGNVLNNAKLIRQDFVSGDLVCKEAFWQLYELKTGKE